MTNLLIEAIDGCSTDNEILDIIQHDESLVNVKDEDNNYPLFIACQYIGYETVAILMYQLYPEALKLQAWKGFRNLCHVCCGYGNPDLIKTIAQQNQTLLSEIDEIGRTPLFYACSKNKTECITTILTYENCLFDVNRRDINGQTALHTCCHHQSFESILILLYCENLDVSICDNDGRTALFYLLLGKSFVPNEMLNKYEVLSRYLTLFPKAIEYLCPSNGNNIFHDAIINGWICDDCLIALLLSRDNVHHLLNQGDNNGATPIHHYCKCIFFPSNLTPYVNNNVININKPDNNGETALHYASTYRRHLLILWLVNNKDNTNIDVIDSDGNTILHSAVKRADNAVTYPEGPLNTVNAIMSLNINLILRRNKHNQTSRDIAMLTVSKVGWRFTSEMFNDWNSAIEILRDYETEYRNKIYCFLMTDTKP
jgi:ankyrin repeat protein